MCQCKAKRTMEHITITTIPSKNEPMQHKTNNKIEHEIIKQKRKTPVTLWQMD